MSVSTEYFDFVFAQREAIPQQLATANRRLAQREAQLEVVEALVDKKAGPKRLRRLDKITGRVEAARERINDLTDQLSEVNAVELPKDEITYSLFNPRDGISGLRVTITDSPYDDSFVGGQETELYLTGTGKSLERGGTQGFGSRVSLVPETFEDGTQTFEFASSGWASKLDGSFPEVTASLQGVVTQIIANGEVVI